MRARAARPSGACVAATSEPAVGQMARRGRRARSSAPAASSAASGSSRIHSGAEDERRAARARCAGAGPATARARGSARWRVERDVVERGSAAPRPSGVALRARRSEARFSSARELVLERGQVAREGDRAREARHRAGYDPPPSHANLAGRRAWTARRASAAASSSRAVRAGHDRAPRPHRRETKAR